MKLCFLLVSFLMAGTASLVAQESESAQSRPKTLFVNGQFAVLFEQKTQGDSIRKLEISQVSVVSHMYDLFAMSKVKISVRKVVGEPKGPSVTYWEHREMIVLLNVSGANTKPRVEFFVFGGQDVAASAKEIFGEVPASLKTINSSLLFVQDLYQIENEKKFLERIEPAMAFAREIIQEAEKFDKKKGLPESLIKQIPQYLPFDPAAWSLVPALPKEEKK